MGYIVYAQNNIAVAVCGGKPEIHGRGQLLTVTLASATRHRHVARAADTPDHGCAARVQPDSEDHETKRH